MNETLQMILWTLIPFLELRASIPFGILVANLNWMYVFLVCVITNMILGPVIYLFIDNFLHIFLKIKWIAKIWHGIIEKKQKEVQKYVDKYGELGVAVFIGIPLPGSGSYSGAIVAYLLGMKMKKFIIANIIGVIIAGIIVTLVSVGGSEVLKHLLLRL